MALKAFLQQQVSGFGSLSFIHLQSGHNEIYDGDIDIQYLITSSCLIPFGFLSI